MVYTSYVLEAYLTYFLFKHALPTKGKKKQQVIGMFLLMLLIILLRVFPCDTILRGLLVFIAQVIFAVTCFDGTVVEKICWGASVILIVSAADRITFHIADIMMMTDSLRMLLEPGLIREKMLVVYMIIRIILTFLVSKLRLRRFWLTKKHLAMILILVGGGVVVLDWLLDSIIVLHDLHLDDAIFNKISAACFLIQMILVLTLYLIIHMGGIYYEKQQLEEQRLMDGLEKKEYELLKASAETMRSWRHDIKNRMEALNGILSKGNDQEALQYLSEMNGEIDRDFIVVGTDNTVLNAIISTKKRLAEENGISFDYQIVWNGRICLNGSELASLMGNLLDNAIEACMLLPESSHRYLCLKILPCSRMVKIVVENSYDGHLKREGIRLISRKKEPGHGLGSQKICKIVEKHGGSCDFWGDEKTFTASILLTEGEEEKDAAVTDRNRRE